MRDDENVDSDVEEGLASSLGVLKVDADHGKSMYIGQEHWHTLLTDIAEVKNYYASHKKDLEKSYEKIRASKPLSAREGPSFLLGATPITEVELRAELPSKSSVLTLCGRYFNTMDNAVNIIHMPTFHQQLRKHWEDPSKSSVMWLGMLYGILTLAMLSYQRSGDEPPEWKGRTLELAAEYRLRTVQCLITGDYTKPHEYTVETLLLYVFGEYSSRWDADMTLWLVTSLIVRLALRMGYHRDGKWFSSLTPFQAEMRRRVWAVVRMSDVVFSHQVSLPSMVYEHDCDTELPRNLFDEEFGPDTKELPPSRPFTEPTPISYMIAKIKLCQELGNILQATNRVKDPVHYDDILRFDVRLREVQEEMPPHLRMQPLEGSSDPLQLIMARFNLNILYLKIMCLLHRKYMSRARHNPRYAHSRRSAIEAAMETLRHLATLYRESQSNGRLRSIKWYVNSIATKDFLLPAMLVVLDLHHDISAERSGLRQDSQTQYFWTPEQRVEMVNILEFTMTIWKGLADGSMEATKASQILDIMLKKINQPCSGPANPASSAASGRADVFADGPGTDLHPDHSAAMTLGMLSGGMSPNTAAALNSIQSPGGTSYPMDLGSILSPPITSAGPPTGMSDFSGAMYGLPNPGSPFSSMFGADPSTMDFTATNFDWDSIENYAQTANWGIDQSFQIIPTNPNPMASTTSPNNAGSSDGYTTLYTPSSGSGRPT